MRPQWVFSLQFWRKPMLAAGIEASTGERIVIRSSTQSIQSTLLASPIGLALLLLLASALQPCTAQAPVSSENGFGVTAHGTVRVFVVFAEVEFDNSCSGRSGTNGENSDWRRNQLPDYKNSLFDHIAPVGAPSGLVTDYYHQMSFGGYRVLGDHYPRLISMPARDALGNCQPPPSSEQVLDRVAADHGPSGPFAGVPITTANGHALADFDLWTPRGAYRAPSNVPNGQGDLALVIWRNYYERRSEECLGYCPLGTMAGAYGNPFGTLSGFAMHGQFTSGSQLHSSLLTILFHEYSHALFGGNEWHIGWGAGAGVPYTTLLPNGPYGMTAQLPSVGFVANGWDRNQLGWRAPGKTRLISALDAAGLNEVNADIGIDTHPNGATFTLRDFITTGDALRIRLPHLNWVPGAARNQYLWLENHQSLRRRFDGTVISAGVPNDDRLFDVNMPGYDACVQKWRPGLMAQIQIGKDMKDTDLNSTSGLDAGDINAEPNAQPNFLVPLSADGFHDFYYRFDQTSAAGSEPCQWGNIGYPIDRPRSLPNPFTGSSDVYWYVDGGNGSAASRASYVASTDGTIFRNDAQSVLVDYVDGRIERHLRQAGDSRDTFSLAAGRSKLAMGTNPAPVPFYTFATPTSGDSQGAPQASAAAYDNRTVWLNGLSVEISEERPQADNSRVLVVRVRWDEQRIANDIRWAGNIVLQNDARDPLARQSKIVLGAGRNLYLDRGLSPTQHIANAGTETVTFPPSAPSVYPVSMAAERDVRLFTQPTRLLVKSGAKVHLERDSRLWLFNGSTLEIESGGLLICEPGARVEGTITAAAGSVLKAGDLNSDGIVDKADLELLLAAVIARKTPFNTLYDLNEDGKLDVADTRKLVTVYSSAAAQPCRQ